MRRILHEKKTSSFAQTFYIKVLPERNKSGLKEKRDTAFLTSQPRAKGKKFAQGDTRATKMLYLAANASAPEDTTFRSPKSSIMPKIVLIEAKKNGVVVMPT